MLCCLCWSTEKVIVALALWSCSAALTPPWCLCSRPCVQSDGSQSQQIRQRARGRFVTYVTEIQPEHEEVVTCPDYLWLVRVQLLGLHIPLLEYTHIPVNSLVLHLNFWSVFSLFSSHTRCPSPRGTIIQKVLHNSFQCLKSSATIKTRVHSCCLVCECYRNHKIISLHFYTSLGTWWSNLCL